MLMILLSILCVIRHLICSCNLNWLLNLYLIYETLWTGIGSGLLIFDIDVKMDGSVFEEKSSFKMLWVTFSSKLDWRNYMAKQLLQGMEYKKKRHKKIKAYRKWLVHFCYWCESGWVWFWGKIFWDATGDFFF